MNKSVAMQSVCFRRNQKMFFHRKCATLIVIGRQLFRLSSLQSFLFGVVDVVPSVSYLVNYPYYLGAVGSTSGSFIYSPGKSHIDCKSLFI